MKVYALIYTTGKYPPDLNIHVFAVTHARSLLMACRKFRVTLATKDLWDSEAMSKFLPMPPKAQRKEFIQVAVTDESAAEIGHVQSIPAIFSCMTNKGAWVCELAVLD